MRNRRVTSPPIRHADGADRSVPAEDGVVPARPELGGGAATPSFRLPEGAPSGLPTALGETRIGPRVFRWGERTFVMGILNVTPDSFSGDGLLAGGSQTAAGRRAGTTGPVARALDLARAMVAEGADILDVGGESSRPGHATVDAAEEIRRVVPVIAAIRVALPDVPLSVDTIKPAVAAAAIDAGAALVNDVWGVAEDDCSSVSRLSAAFRSSSCTTAPRPATPL
jgi:hypothetical protein